MIYPIDVNKQVQNKRKLAGENKSQLIITIIILSNFFGIFGLSFFLNMFFTASFGTVLLCILAIDLVVIILYFRFSVFGEDERKSEYKGFDSDSFSKRLYLNRDIQEQVDIAGKKVNVFEFIDGSSTCILEFRFGSNDTNKAANTKILLNNVQLLLSRYDFESRFLVMPENFKSSNEFKSLIKTMNTVNDKKLRKAVLEIIDAIMQDSYQSCNTEVLYLQIRTQSNYQKFELESVLLALFKLITESVTAFRSVTFLDMSSLLELYRDFYLISAIDLSMMQSIDLSQEVNDAFDKVSYIFSVKSDRGKIYQTSESTEHLFELKERRIANDKFNVNSGK